MSFSTLSSGEKRRLICTLALEKTKTKPQIKLLILDEPLAQLDSASIQDQIDILHQIQKLPHAPALLIISHHHIDELTKQLSQLQLIKFDEENLHQKAFKEILTENEILIKNPSKINIQKKFFKCRVKLY